MFVISFNNKIMRFLISVFITTIIGLSVLIASASENSWIKISAQSSSSSSSSNSIPIEQVLSSGFPIRAFLEFLNKTKISKSNNSSSSSVKFPTFGNTGSKIEASPLLPSSLRKRRTRVRGYYLQPYWTYWCKSIYQAVNFIDTTARAFCLPQDIVDQAIVDMMLEDIIPLFENWVARHLEFLPSNHRGVRHVDRRYGNCEEMIKTVPLPHIRENGGPGILERTRDLRGYPTTTSNGQTEAPVPANPILSYASNSEEAVADLVIYFTNAFSQADVDVYPCQWDPITGRPTIIYFNVGPYSASQTWGLDNPRGDVTMVVWHYYLLGGLIRGLGLERTLFDNDPTSFADVGFGQSSSRRKTILEEFFEDSTSASSKIFRTFTSSSATSSSTQDENAAICTEDMLFGFRPLNRTMPETHDTVIRQYWRPESLLTQDMITPPLKQYVDKQFSCYSRPEQGATLENFYRRQEPSIVNSIFKCKFFTYDFMTIPYFNLYITNLTWGFLASTGWYFPQWDRTNMQTSPWGLKSTCGLFDLCNWAPWRHQPGQFDNRAQIITPSSFVYLNATTATQVQINARINFNDTLYPLTRVRGSNLTFIPPAQVTLVNYNVSSAAFSTSSQTTAVFNALNGTAFSNASVFRAEFCFQNSQSRCNPEHRQLLACQVFSNLYPPIPTTQMQYFGSNTDGGYSFFDYCPILGAVISSCDASADSFCFDNVEANYVAVNFTDSEKPILQRYFTITGNSMCARAFMCDPQTKSYQVFRTQTLFTTTNFGNLVKIADCYQTTNIAGEVETTIFQDPYSDTGLLYACPQYEVVCVTSEQTNPEAWSRTGQQYQMAQDWIPSSQTVESLDDIVVHQFQNFQIAIDLMDMLVPFNSSTTSIFKAVPADTVAIDNEEYLNSVLNTPLMSNPSVDNENFWRETSQVQVNMSSAKIRFTLRRNDVCRYGGLLVMHWRKSSPLQFNLSKMKTLDSLFADDNNNNSNTSSLDDFISKNIFTNYSQVLQPQAPASMLYSDYPTHKLQNYSFVLIGDNVDIAGKLEAEIAEFYELNEGRTHQFESRSETNTSHVIAILISEPILSLWTHYEIEIPSELISYQVPWPSAMSSTTTSSFENLNDIYSSPESNARYTYADAGTLPRVSLYSLFPPYDVNLTTGRPYDVVDNSSILSTDSSNFEVNELLGRTETNSFKTSIGNKGWIISEVAFASDVSTTPQQGTLVASSQNAVEFNKSSITSRFTVEKLLVYSSATGSFDPSLTQAKWYSAKDYATNVLPNACLTGNLMTGVILQSQVAASQLSVDNIGTEASQISLKISIAAMKRDRPTFSIASVSYIFLLAPAGAYEVYGIRAKYIDDLDQATATGRWRRSTNASGYCLDPSISKTTLVFKQSIPVDYLIVDSLLRNALGYLPTDPRIGASVLVSLPYECSNVDVFVTGFKYALLQASTEKSPSINTPAILSTSYAYVTQASRRNVSESFIPSNILSTQFVNPWNAANSPRVDQPRPFKTVCFRQPLTSQALRRSTNKTTSPISVDLRSVCDDANPSLSASFGCPQRAATLAFSFTPVVPREGLTYTVDTRGVQLGDSFILSFNSGKMWRRDENMRHPWFNLTAVSPFCPGIFFVGVYQYQRVTITAMRASSIDPVKFPQIQQDTCIGPKFAQSLVFGGFVRARVAQYSIPRRLPLFEWRRMDSMFSFTQPQDSNGGVCGNVVPTTVFTLKDIDMPNLVEAGNQNTFTVQCSGRGVKTGTASPCACDPGFGGPNCEVCAFKATGDALALVDGANSSCLYSCDTSLPSYWSVVTVVPWRDKCIAAGGVMDPQDKCHCYCQGILCFYTHTKSVTPEIAPTTTTTTSATTTSTSTTSSTTSSTTTSTSTSTTASSTITQTPVPPGQTTTTGPSTTTSTTTTTTRPIMTTTSATTTTTTPTPTFCPPSGSSWYAVLSTSWPASQTIANFKTLLWTAMQNVSNTYGLPIPSNITQADIDVVAVCPRTKPKCYRWIPDLMAGPDSQFWIVIFQLTPHTLTCALEPSAFAEYTNFLKNSSSYLIAFALQNRAFQDAMQVDNLLMPLVAPQPIPRPPDYTVTKSITPLTTSTTTTTTTTTKPSSTTKPTTTTTMWPHSSSTTRTTKATNYNEPSTTTQPTLATTQVNVTGPPLLFGEFVFLDFTLFGLKKGMRLHDLESLTIKLSIIDPSRWPVQFAFDCPAINAAINETSSSQITADNFFRTMSGAILASPDLYLSFPRMSSLPDSFVCQTNRSLYFSVNVVADQQFDSSQLLSTNVQIPLLKTDIFNQATSWGSVLVSTSSSSSTSPRTAQILSDNNNKNEQGEKEEEEQMIEVIDEFKFINHLGQEVTPEDEKILADLRETSHSGGKRRPLALKRRLSFTTKQVKKSLLVLPQSRRQQLREASALSDPRLAILPASSTLVIPTIEVAFFWRALIVYMKYGDAGSLQQYPASAYLPADAELDMTMDSSTSADFASVNNGNAAAGFSISIQATAQTSSTNQAGDVLLSLATVALAACASPAVILPIIVSSFGIVADRCRLTNPALGALAGVHTFPSVPSAIFGKFDDADLSFVAGFHIIMALVFVGVPAFHFFWRLLRVLDHEGRDVTDLSNPDQPAPTLPHTWPRLSYQSALVLLPGCCYWMLVGIYASTATSIAPVRGLDWIIGVSATLILIILGFLTYFYLARDISSLRENATYIPEGYEQLKKLDNNNNINNNNEEENPVREMMMRQPALRFGINSLKFTPHICLPSGRWDFEMDSCARLVPLFWFSDGSHVKRVRLGPVLLMLFGCSFLCLPMMSGGATDSSQLDGFVIPGSEYGAGASRLCSLELWLTPIFMCLLISAVFIFGLVRHFFGKILWIYGLIYSFAFAGLVWSARNSNDSNEDGSSSSSSSSTDNATQTFSDGFKQLFASRISDSLLTSLTQYIVIADAIMLFFAIIVFIEAMMDMIVWTPLARSLDLQQSSASDALSMQLLSSTQLAAREGGGGVGGDGGSPSSNNNNNNNVDDNNNSANGAALPSHALARALSVLESAHAQSRLETRIDRRSTTTGTETSSQTGGRNNSIFGAAAASTATANGSSSRRLNRHSLARLVSDDGPPISTSEAATLLGRVMEQRNNSNSNSNGDDGSSNLRYASRGDRLEDDVNEVLLAAGIDQSPRNRNNNDDDDDDTNILSNQRRAEVVSNNNISNINADAPANRPANPFAQGDEFVSTSTSSMTAPAVRGSHLRPQQQQVDSTTTIQAPSSSSTSQRNGTNENDENNNDDSSTANGTGSRRRASRRRGNTTTTNAAARRRNQARELEIHDTEMPPSIGEGSSRDAASASTFGNNNNNNNNRRQQAARESSDDDPNSFWN